ncbi:MAG: ABC transporter permease [Butyrivibrio sp.]
MNDKISESHRLYLKDVKRKNLFVRVLRFLLAFLFIGGWELLTRLRIIDSFIFSSPSRIIKCFIELSESGIIFRHMGITVAETLICFLIVIGLALSVSMLMWRFRMIFRVAEPYFVLLNSLPKSALAPVLIVWLGNNIKTVIVAAVSVAVFGAVLSIYTSFIETEPEKIKLIRTLGGNRRQTLFLLIIPSSLPAIINTMKVNLGLSLVGVIIGEFLAARQGLGYMIIYATQTFKMDWVLLSIVILCILSVGMYQLINLPEKKRNL